MSEQNQSIGVSPSFLSEIKPTSDGTNSISYNLTTDMIDSVFRTYPQGMVTYPQCMLTYPQNMFTYHQRVLTYHQGMLTYC